MNLGQPDKIKKVGLLRNCHNFLTWHTKNWLSLWGSFPTNFCPEICKTPGNLPQFAWDPQLGWFVTENFAGGRVHTECLACAVTLTPASIFIALDWTYSCLEVSNWTNRAFLFKIWFFWFWNQTWGILLVWLAFVDQTSWSILFVFTLDELTETKTSALSRSLPIYKCLFCQISLAKLCRKSFENQRHHQR